MRYFPFRQRDTVAKVTVRLWTGFGIAVLLLAQLLVQKYAGSPFRKTFRRTVPDDGPGIAAHCTLPDAYRNHPWAYRFVTVYENGKALPHRIPADRGTAEQGNGCYQAKQGVLWFVGSDGTDPRKNGREYKASGPRLVPAWALWLSAAASVTSGAGLLACRSTRLQLRRGIRAANEWLRSPPSFCPVEKTKPQNPARPENFSSRICVVLSRYIWLVLALPSFFILTRLPPLWKDIDGVIQVTSQAGPTTILHFPPLYCFVSRALLLPGEMAEWLLAGGPAPEWNLAGNLTPTDAGLYSLIIAQHVMLWLVLAQLIRTCTRVPWIQMLLAVATLTFAPFYTIANCVGSEAGGMLVLILFVTICIKLSCESAPRYLWIALVGVLCACIITRHIYASLAMVMPAAFAISFVLALARRGEALGGRQGRYVKLCVVSLVAGVVGIAAANLTLRALCFSCEVEYRAEYGQTIADRLWNFLRGLPVTEREELERSVMRRSDDPGTKEAIRSLAEIGSFYSGGYRTVEKFLETSAHQYWEVKDAEVSRRFNRATLLYLKTMHPKLVESILVDFNRGLFKSDVPELAYFPIETHVWIFDMVPRSRDNPTWKGISRVRSFNPASRPALESWRQAPYLRIYRNVSPAWIFVVASLLAIGAVIKRRAAVQKSALALALIVCSLVAFFLNMIVVYYLGRYTMPMYVLGVVATYLSFSALLEVHPLGKGAVAQNQAG